jgi:archaellum component FlaC
MKKIDEQGKHIQDLRDEIEILKTNHKDDVSHLQTKAKGLNLKINTKIEENSRLTRALEDLWNTFGFVARCSTKIRKKF